MFWNVLQVNCRENWFWGKKSAQAIPQKWADDNKTRNYSCALRKYM
jgi:hypothetical protein